MNAVDEQLQTKRDCDGLSVRAVSFNAKDGAAIVCASFECFLN